jgi:hypothetical protein
MKNFHVILGVRLIRFDVKPSKPVPVNYRKKNQVDKEAEHESEEEEADNLYEEYPEEDDAFAIENMGRSGWRGEEF